jgi:WD40 repeat protein
LAAVPPLPRFPGHTKIVRTVAFSPDGKRIVTASPDGTAKIYGDDFDELLKRTKQDDLPVDSGS